MAALLLPTVARRYPFVPGANLDEAHEAIAGPVDALTHRYQISAHIRHQAREILLSCYRIARGKAYEEVGVDALFFTGIKSRGELEAISAATKLPIVLGGAPEEMSDPAWLAGQRVRIALQGHAPFAAATQAVYDTLRALREGTAPKNLKGLASSELTARTTRDAGMKARTSDFLGLKK